ncbi:MAG: hypothetical protein R3F56_17490 [Planctomycetota bacterium]
MPRLLLAVRTLSLAALSLATLSLAALSLAALSPALAAQTPPCLSLNDGTNAVSGNVTGYGFAGPDSRAWQFSPPQNLTVESAQIYTGNTFFSQDMRLEIWSDNGANLPLAALGGGAWKISTSTPRGWQGTNFDRPVALGQSLLYWLVWTEPGTSLLPIEPGGVSTPTALSIAGGVWQTQGAQAPKFRLFCNLLDAQSVTPNGAPCPNAAGLGTALTNQAPTIGNADFLVDGTGFPANVPAVMIVGFTPGWISIPVPGGPPGCQLHTDPFLLFAGATGNGNVRQSTGSSGHSFFPLPIPNVAALNGLFVSVQMAAVDVSFSVPVPLVTSNALQLLLY